MKKLYLKKTKALFLLLFLVPFLSFAQIDLLQTTNNNIAFASIACQNNNITSTNSYARLYNLTTLGYSSFQVTKVSFAVYDFQLGTAPNFPVSVEVYASTGGTTDANLTLMGQESVNITTAMVGTIVEVPFATPATVSSTEMLIVVSAPDGTTTTTKFLPGANSNGQTAPGYIKAAACGATNFTSFIAAGDSNNHLVLFPTGNATVMQCPPGDVVLTTQAQVDQFIIDYPNCTSISGYLQIGKAVQLSPGDITDLAPLSNIHNVSGNLYIQNNADLQDVDGLQIETVGGWLYIGGDNSTSTNLQLTNLNGLSSLTSVAQDIYISYNPVLTDISALENTTFAPADGYGLTILDNLALAVCNLPNFCTYLANPASTHPRNISGNLAECVSEAAVVAACASLSAEDFTTTNINVYPNPAKEMLFFSEEVSNVKIIDISGKIVKQLSVKATSVNVADLQRGIYILSGITADGIILTKKIIKE